MAQLGGHATFLDTSMMQISHGESAKDTATILSSFGHMIACRYCNWGLGNKYLREMAKWSTVPIINLQCDLYHPMQALADLMTMQELFPTKRLKVLLLGLCYKPRKISVPFSNLYSLASDGCYLSYPEGYDLPDWAMKKPEECFENGGSSHTNGYGRSL